MLSRRALSLPRPSRLGLVALALFFAGALRAQFVMPTSYTATFADGQAQGGSFNYFDDTGAQLTDGSFGIDDWTANLGHGNAYEWVGWIASAPTLTFSFGSPVTVSAVTIGLSRAENAGIYLPPSITIGSEIFALARNTFADQTRADLTFALAQPFTGTQLAITLNGNVGNWTFLDEIQFLTPVPEPSTPALLALGAGTILLAHRRRRASALALKREHGAE